MSRIRSAIGRIFAREKRAVEVVVETSPKPAIDPEALTKLQSEVAELRRWILASRKVEMVDFGDIRAFLYADDLGYQQIADTYKGKQPDGEKRELSDRRTPAERYANPSEPLMSTLLSHFWLQRIPFVALDIGCQYGISAIAMAQIIRACGEQNKVYAFDPGVAGSLAPFNIELNHLTDLITFEPGLLLTE